MELTIKAQRGRLKSEKQQPERKGADDFYQEPAVKQSLYLSISCISDLPSNQGKTKQNETKPQIKGVYIVLINRKNRCCILFGFVQAFSVGAVPRFPLDICGVLLVVTVTKSYLAFPYKCWLSYQIIQLGKKYNFLIIEFNS